MAGHRFHRPTKPADDLSSGRCRVSSPGAADAGSRHRQGSPGRHLLHLQRRMGGGLAGGEPDRALVDAVLHDLHAGRAANGAAPRGRIGAAPVGPTMLGQDMPAFLEEAVPGLAQVTAPEPLFLPDLPYSAVGLDHRPHRSGLGRHRWPSTTRLAPRWRGGVRRIAGRGRGGGRSRRPGHGRVHVRLERPAQGSGAYPRLDRAHDHGVPRPNAGDNEPRAILRLPVLLDRRIPGPGWGAAGGLTVCCLERFEPEAALDMVEKERCGMVAGLALADPVDAHPPTLSRGGISSTARCSCPAPPTWPWSNTPVAGYPRPPGHERDGRQLERRRAQDRRSRDR